MFSTFSFLPSADFVESFLGAEDVRQSSAEAKHTAADADVDERQTLSQIQPSVCKTENLFTTSEVQRFINSIMCKPLSAQEHFDAEQVRVKGKIRTLAGMVAVGMANALAV